MEIFSLFILPVLIAALFLEFVDIVLGMGYGTAVAPLLLLLGFHPLEFVPVLLASNVVIGFVAGFFHHQHENIDLASFSKDVKVTLMLSAFGIVAVLLAVLTAVNLPENVAVGYIGVLIILIGIFTFRRHSRRGKFAWWKIMLTGLLGAFNKGMAGGGYGPVVVGGQVLSGVEGKSAVGIAAVAEGVVSIAGIGTYLWFGIDNFRLDLFVSLATGGIIAIPLATYTVSKIQSGNLKRLIAVACIILGIATLVRLVWDGIRL